MKAPTKAERKLHQRMREMGCACCLFVYHWPDSPADIHHLIEGGRRLGHDRVIPLCPIHHRQGTAEHPSVHSVNGCHGGHAEFKRVHGVDDRELESMALEYLGVAA
jgi:hypothetical protein